MRLLLINPNLTEAVTERCAATARTVASPGTEIVAVTGEVGAAIINSRAEDAIAAHGLLTLLAQHAPEADAVLLAVSYDTALLAARELVSIPVVGMTEAAMTTACLVGARFGLIVFGTPWVYRELVRAQGFEARFAGIRSLDAAATTALSDPMATERAVLAAATDLATVDGADCVVLCGAALAGMGQRLAAETPVPLVDGISCGVPLCEMLVRLALPAPRLGSLVSPRNRRTAGLHPALAAALATPEPKR
ncbi:MAG: hydantoin racemase [Alphaproteobacteria bacterium]|nr:aspartate/glutamate racemase family protein [Alphaproteobacteria bacterium]TAD88865.1 MAG: hydantoin racemase [Alphaproteobacteria bacterium]